MGIDELIQKHPMMATRAQRALAMAAGLAVFAAARSAACAAQYTAADLYAVQGTDYEISGAFGGQVVAGSVLWKPDGSAVDLNLSGFNSTRVAGTDGIYQFGYAVTGQPGYGVTSTPVVWSGSAASATFLNKQGFGSAGVAGSGGGQFVGWGDDGALLWKGLTAKPIDLRPTNLVGFVHTYAYGTNGTQQVGSGYGFDANNSGYSHALLWTGSANSAVDLNPPSLPGITSSEAIATDGQQQVGNGNSSLVLDHALLWSGTANSAVDLNTSGFHESEAYGVLNGKQVGYGVGTDGFNHALLWSGTAASVIDLGTFLPAGFANSIAYSLDKAGDVWGGAYDSADGLEHAIEWIPVLPGDFNRDGHVNAADVLAMEQALANLPSYQITNSLSDAQLLAIGDIDSDGKITNADLQALLDALKSGGGSADSVPEPASWVLAFLALAVVSGTRFCVRCVR